MSRMPSPLQALLAIAILVGVGSSESAAAASAVETVNAVITDLGLQRELPMASEPDRWRIGIPPWVLWLVILGGAVTIAAYLGGQIPIWDWRTHDWSGGTAGPAGSTATPPEQALGEADDLARQGRFVEAMHLLLLRGLAELRRRLDEEFADSLTSREILRRTRVSPRGRDALLEIVARVEWAYFGERAATEADYGACRRRYDELTDALSDGASA